MPKAFLLVLSVGMRGFLSDTERPRELYTLPLISTSVRCTHTSL